MFDLGHFLILSYVDVCDVAACCGSDLQDDVALMRTRFALPGEFTAEVIIDGLRRRREVMSVLRRAVVQAGSDL
jgi:hypothetical protein